MNSDRSLRLATWNIHMGVGTDGRRDLARTAAIIKRLSPDVIGLQEVDNRHDDQAADVRLLSDATGLRVVSGPTMQRSDGEYGNALLTRLPVTRIERHKISVLGREPRGLLLVRLDWRGAPLQVAVTHLGLRPGERRSQVRQLIGLLSSRQDAPLVLMGDFNEWLFWGRPLRWLRRHFGAFRSPATFPSRWPLLRLDHILCDRPGHLSPPAVIGDRDVRVASDHLPLTATYRPVA